MNLTEEHPEELASYIVEGDWYVHFADIDNWCLLMRADEHSTRNVATVYVSTRAILDGLDPCLSTFTTPKEGGQLNA